MDHSRTAVKQFLVYAEEPHGIKFVSDPSPLGGSLSVCDSPIDLQREKSGAPTRDTELMII